jgi:HEPN domain-containing protein
MTGRRKTTPVARADALAYLRKAKEFLQEAEVAAAQDRFDAAMVMSIHAAISSCDAATAALQGVRSSDPDHMRSADLLEEVGAPGEKVRQLRTLLGRKTVVEYGSRRATSREGNDAVARAQRFVEWCDGVVRNARIDRS